MTKRQDFILQFIKRHPNTNSAAIVEYMANAWAEKSSRATVLRDIDALVSGGLVIKSGSARATTYAPAIDIESYFAIDPDKRTLKHEYFNFDIWDVMHDLFSPKELSELDTQNKTYRQNKAELSPTELRKEIERLTIEFAWKSSKIEGNTYTLLDTERLIKDKTEAAGKKKDEAIMILNHKAALDFIFEQPDFFEQITIAKVEHIHRLLTGELEIENGIRQRRVRIIGTNYRPLDNRQQIMEALEKMVDLINGLPHPLEKALAAVLLISYIQPFEDGNKRTARTVGNALLLAADYCPLSYRSADEIEYKKGMILFYEQNDWSYFKTIFTDQFRQGIEKYF